MSWCILPAPPLWNRISLCFCGIPFPHRRGFVLCFLRHPLPPPLRFCGFPTVRAGQGGRRTRPPPPPVEQDGFPFCHTHTHTHTTHTHTHTHTPHTPRVCVSLRTCSSAKPPFHSLVWGQATYDTGCGTPVVGVLQASSRGFRPLYLGGDTIGGGGARTHSAQPCSVIYIYICTHHTVTLGVYTACLLDTGFVYALRFVGVSLEPLLCDSS